MEAMYPVVSPRRSLTEPSREPTSPRRLPRLSHATKDSLVTRTRRQIPREYSIFRVAPTQHFQRTALSRSDTDVVHQRSRVDSFLGQLEASNRPTEVPQRRRFPRLLQAETGRSGTHLLLSRKMLEKPEVLTGQSRPPAAQRQLSQSYSLRRSEHPRKVATPRKVQLRGRFRRLARFIVVFFRLWRSHALKVDRFLRGNVNLFEIHDQADLMFDKSFFRRKVAISADTRRILLKPPTERTAEEVRYVQLSLAGNPTFSAYPLDIQTLMSQQAWYECYGPRRAILLEGHVVTCYYFLLSGSVLVSKMDRESNSSRTVTSLWTGDSFGELGIVNAAPRAATIISRETVELLVFTKQDYMNIFGSGRLKSVDNQFMKRHYCVEGISTALLEAHPALVFVKFFRRGVVIQEDSWHSEWIYIVKSGTCRVLKKLQAARPPVEGRVNKRRRQKSTELSSEEDGHHDTEHDTATTGRLPLIDVRPNRTAAQRSFITRTRLAGRPAPDARDPDSSKERLMAKKRQRRIRDSNRTVNNERNNGLADTGDRPTEVSKDPTFVQIDTLVEGGVFGLVDVLVSDQPRVALVSNAAECIVINKRFYLEHMPQKQLAVLRSQVQPYPSDDDLQVSLQTHVDWQQRKKRALLSAVKRTRARHANVHDSRDMAVPQWTDRRVSRC